MNLTRLERLTLRQLGRVKQIVTKNLKKFRLAKQTLLFALTVPLVIPVSAVNAQKETVTEEPTAVFETSLALTLDDHFVSAPAKQISITVVESQYQAAQRVRLAQAAQAKAVTTKTVAHTADPGLAVKREWAQRAAAAYGIRWQLLEAVWQIESGKRWYFTGGSYAGARGPCQFMPGTWRAYAEDGNGDGVSDVYDARDCLFGAAKLLARNGAAAGDERRALFAYNHSQSYVTKVLGIAASIEQ
jgi:membrane-bound lytic murein transglycosylase B